MEHIQLSAAPGVDPALDGRAGHGNVVLGKIQGDARRNADLPLHQIESGEHFRDAVFHLQSDIHLHEPEISGLIQQEFQRSCPNIADFPDGIHRPCDDCLPLVRRHSRRGGLLDELLVAPLQRAVPLPQAHHISLLVCQNLQFHVPGGIDVFFQIQRAVSEGTDGLGGSLMPGILQFLFRAHPADAPTAATGAGLQHYGVTNGFGSFFRFFQSRQRPGSGNHRQIGGLDQAFQRCLVAEPLHIRRVRTDEHQSVFPAGTGKMGIFREKTIARMDGLSAGQQGGADDLALVQVAFRGFRTADAVAFIRQRHVQGILVRLGIDCHRGDAHFLAGPDDPHGDLAPVGNENF